MKFILIFFGMIFFYNFAHAQVTTREIQSLNFGTILADPSGDTITVRRNNRIRRRNSSDLQGGHSAALLEFRGPSQTSISYSFSPKNTLTAPNGEILLLNNFRTNRRSPFSLRRRGVRNMRIGADLIIPANINGGVFSGTYTLIFDYQ